MRLRVRDAVLRSVVALLRMANLVPNRPLQAVSAKPRSLFCSKCCVWWPLGNPECPHCLDKTTSDPRRPNRTEEHALFERWLWKNDRQVTDEL
jgi:hypothetical protein